MRIDLQLHSRYSDGYYTPAQLVRFLLRHGIKAASLTDHNTVVGQGEFRRACAHPGYLPANHMADAIWDIPSNRRLIKSEIGPDLIREEDIMRFCLFPKVGPRLQDAHVSLTRVLKLRKQIGGQLIFCHPGLNNRLRGKLLDELLSNGVDGVELLSPHHGYNTIMYLNSVVKKEKIITSGGSDFHKVGEEGTRPRYSWDYFVIKSEYLPGVSKILDNKK